LYRSSFEPYTIAMTPIRAACPHDCPDTCAMEVKVQLQNGKRVATHIQGAADHAPTAGVLCTKVSRYLERTYHTERLTTPLKRAGKKGEGKFVAVSWDTALADIAVRLKAIAAIDPQRIVPYSYAGTMGLVQGEGMAARFFNKLGASFLERTICSAAGAAGLATTTGRVGVDMEFAQEAKLIIFWGANAVASNLHFWTRAQQAKRNGARLIAIDPYRSLTAEKCHQHIALLPGTDAAFALGMMHVLLRDNLLDHDYIAVHTVGFEALKERAQQWPAQRAAQVCGVTAQDIEQLAALYAQTALQGQGALIRCNYGMQRARGGGNATRAIACLPGLVGAFKHRAGGLLFSTSGWYPINNAALQRPELLAGRTPRTINMSDIGHALHNTGPYVGTPPVDALIVYNSNPVAVAPDSAAVARGFAREDLFTVVLEHFQTDTADYADYVLPATTQLEHLDIHRSYGHLHILANNPAIDPIGQSLPNAEIFRRLAAHMGFTEPCFGESDDQLAAQAFEWNHPTLQGITWKQLKREGWAKLKIGSDTPFAAGGFHTPSSKLEFFSAQLQQQGKDPLPDYVAPLEDIAGPHAQRYPLALISPPARNFLNSTFVNVQSLRTTEGTPHLDIHPQDAVARNIQDGATVRIFNDRGSFCATARVTDRARVGVPVALSIWWKKLAPDGKNVNEVTGQALTDLGNGATFYDCLVQVENAQVESMQAEHAEYT
jgi:anaerobic selenocysteine-containing dehydrogenase